MATIEDMTAHKSTRQKPRRSIKFVHWKEGDFYLGYLQDYPDYWTQGRTLSDLKEHLADLHNDVSGGTIPGIRKVGELVLP